MGRLKNFFVEWQARRTGARFVQSDLSSAARQIIGPTGNLYSNGWEAFENGRHAYVDSFDPVIPPSLHISAQDSRRSNQPIPLVERCIEDWNRTTDPSPRDFSA